MDLFAKRCEYCRTKIKKGREIKKDVKVPGYIGTYPKNFCSDEHAKQYMQEIEEHLKNPKTGSKGCCG